MKTITLRGVSARWFIAALPLFSACYKNELEVDKLTNNPFDREYVGPSVFSFDTTFTEVINGDLIRQVFQFRVASELFLAPQSYSVFVVDQAAGASEIIPQFPAGSDLLSYYRTPATPGQEVCLQLRLSNNYHHGRAETICGTLP